MSGIAGIYNTDDRPVETKALERMVEVLAHRGPEGSGIWRDGAVGLAHRMFHETPESLHEHQPYEDRGAQLIITADARIDNRDELIHKLDLTKEDPLYISDSHLILLSYAKWGENCVDHLLGDFAFVIWDGRKHSLFCARDYIGIKPFYYFFRESRFIFASELKGILCFKDVPNKLNKEMIASYLIADFEDRENTFYESLLRLTPAHVMRVDRNGVQKRCYWKPDPTYELRLKSDAEYAEKFRELFAEAVHCRLRSAFPVGSTLSGGMDSSSIVCMARDLLKQEGKGRILKTFSATYGHLPQVDEQKYQNAVIRDGGIEPCMVPMNDIGPIESYVAGQRLLEFPYLGSTYYLHYGMHQQMNNRGVRVALDGHGGDDVVQHGYSYLIELARKLKIIKFFRECRRYANVNQIPLPVVIKYGLRPNIPPYLLNFYHFVLRHKISRSEVDSLPIIDAFIKGTLAGKRFYEKKAETNQSSSLREEHASLFNNGLFTFVFEVYGHLECAYSLVTRFPFFDQRLAEFCLSLPHDQKITNGFTRVILRRAMDGILPREIQWRPGKSDLSPHFYKMLLEKERPFLNMLIEKMPDKMASFINISLFQERLLAFFKNNCSDSKFCKDLWPVITFSIWTQACVQN